MKDPLKQVFEKLMNCVQEGNHEKFVYYNNILPDLITLTFKNQLGSSFNKQQWVINKIDIHTIIYFKPNYRDPMFSFAIRLQYLGCKITWMEMVAKFYTKNPQYGDMYARVEPHQNFTEAWKSFTSFTEEQLNIIKEMAEAPPGGTVSVPRDWLSL